MTDIITQLKNNITRLAQAEGKSETDIINELLAGAAVVGHEENVEILIAIKMEMVEAQVKEVLAR